MMRKICVVTGTRAEYGLLRWVMQEITDDPDLELQLLVTGMHLSPDFGLTYKEIENDGFHINHKVEMIGYLDDPVAISESIALGIRGCSIALDQLNPDIILVLGDRFEIFSAAIAAMTARIPIAHIHGGEITEGLIDEAIRHSITKMSHVHFVAALEYGQRVVQLGENPKTVHQVGGLGIDSISRLKLLNKAELEKSLGINFLDRVLVITFHPVTLENQTSKAQMSELLDALSILRDTTLIFTLPNADTGGRVIIELIEKFVKTHKNSHSFASLGQINYFSCLQFADGVVGNSSSGLLEAPSFRIGTINIGNRQQGRLKSTSVIDCEPSSGDISRSIKKLYSTEFQNSLVSAENPYGYPGASKKIVKTIKELDPRNILLKKFFNLDQS